MLSDPSKVESGGETQVRCGDGSIRNVHYPAAGYAIMLQVLPSLWQCIIWRSLSSNMKRILVCLMPLCRGRFAATAQAYLYVEEKRSQMGNQRLISMQYAQIHKVDTGSDQLREPGKLTASRFAGHGRASQCQACSLWKWRALDHGKRSCFALGLFMLTMVPLRVSITACRMF